MISTPSSVEERFIDNKYRLIAASFDRKVDSQNAYLSRQGLMDPEMKDERDKEEEKMKKKVDGATRQERRVPS